MWHRTIKNGAGNRAGAIKSRERDQATLATAVGTLEIVFRMIEAIW